MWLIQLEQMIAQKHMLNTAFYQAWSRGELSREVLQNYAKQYYHHVKAFPTYISALHSRSEDMETRRCLLDNLVDEEAGNPNHPELWRSFALALGVQEKELDEEPGDNVQHLIDTFRQICQTAPLAAGIAALYCYESQIPAICTSKIDGLIKWYGMTNPVDYRYFSVHEIADVEHSQREKQLLVNLVMSEADKKSVLEESEKILSALCDFLNSFHCNCAA